MLMCHFKSFCEKKDKKETSPIDGERRIKFYAENPGSIVI